MAKEEDQAIVKQLLPYTFQLKQLDQMKYELTTTRDKERTIYTKELELVNEALENFGLHTQHYSSIFNDPIAKRSTILNKYPQSLKLLADIYYRSGHLRLTTDVLKQKSSWYAHDYAAEFRQKVELTDHEDAFFHVFTAATLNHKRARFMMAIILENGLIPSRELIEQATAEGRAFNFLKLIVDAKQSVLFKFLQKPEDKVAYQMLAEFEADTKAQAMSNLYLSSQVTSHKMLYDFM